MPKKGFENCIIEENKGADEDAYAESLWHMLSLGSGRKTFKLGALRIGNNI